MSSFDIQHSSVGYRQDTLIDPWDVIRASTIEALDSDPDIFNQAISRSQIVLGNVHVASIQDGAGFFEFLRNNMASEDDILDFLIGLMQWLNFHVESGTVSVQQVLLEHKQNWNRFKQECARKKIYKEADFVGRTNDIESITKELMNPRERYKGVCICGLGGMGKTSLANEVCFRLLNSGSKWRIIKLDMREKSDLCDLLRDLVVEMGGVCQNDSVEDLKEKVFQTLQNIKGNRKTLLLLDNLDDIMTSGKGQLLDFLETLAENLETYKINVKLVITVRQKLIPEQNITQKLTRLFRKATRLSDLILEFELKPLDGSDAVDLLMKCIDRPHVKKPSGKICSSIVHKCGYSPLAICSISSIIRSGFVSPELLTQKLGDQDRQENLSQVSQCLDQAFQTLNSEQKEKLIRLSVCNTSKFGIDVAAYLLGEPSLSQGQTIGMLTKLELLSLKSRHLLEIQSDSLSPKSWYRPEIENESQNDDQPVRTLHQSVEYSIHPLVNEFLKHVAQSSRGEFDGAILDARLKYVEHFETKITKIAEGQDKDFMSAQSVYMYNRVHIKNFFDILLNLPSGHTLLRGIDRIVSCRRMSDIADLVLYDDTKFKLLKKWKGDAKANGSLAEFAFWTIYEAKKFLQADRCEVAMSRLESLRRETLPKMQESKLVWNAVLGCFYSTLGSFYLDSDNPEKAKENYELAREHLSKKGIRSKFMVELVDTINAIGCAHYMWKPEPNYREAIRFHQKAYFELSRRVTNYNNIQIPDIITNIGRAMYKEGILLEKQGNRSGAINLYRQSVSYFSYAMRLDDEFGTHKYEGHAHILLVRCDSYCKLGRFEEARKDVDQCFELRRRNLRPPNWKITITQHRKGEVMMNLGILAYKKGDKSRALNLLYEAIGEYEHATHLIKLGGLTTDHPEYQSIKDNHRWLLLQTKDKQKLDKMMQFYADLENGKYDINFKTRRTEKETTRPTLTKKELDALASSGRLFSAAPPGTQNESSDSDDDIIMDDSDEERQSEINVRFNDRKTKLVFNEFFRNFPDADDFRKHYDIDSDNEEEFIEDIFIDSTDISSELPDNLKPSKGDDEDDMDVDDDAFSDEKISQKDLEDQMQMRRIERKSKSLSISSQNSTESNFSESDSASVRRSHFKHKGSRDPSLQSFLTELDQSIKQERSRLKSSASSSLELSMDESIESGNFPAAEKSRAQRKMTLQQLHMMKHEESIDEEGIEHEQEVEEETTTKYEKVKGQRKREASEDPNASGSQTKYKP